MFRWAGRASAARKRVLVAAPFLVVWLFCVMAPRIAFKRNPMQHNAPARARVRSGRKAVPPLLNQGPLLSRARLSNLAAGNIEDSTTSEARMQHSQLDRRCRPLSAAEHCCWRGMPAHASFSDDPFTQLHPDSETQLDARRIDKQCTAPNTSAATITAACTTVRDAAACRRRFN